MLNISSNIYSLHEGFCNSSAVLKRHITQMPVEMVKVLTLMCTFLFCC